MGEEKQKVFEFYFVDFVEVNGLRMSWNPSVPKEIVIHAQRVCRLYKRAIRECENYALSRHEFRYDATVMRDRFSRREPSRTCESWQSCWPRERRSSTRSSTTNPSSRNTTSTVSSITDTTSLTTKSRTTGIHGKRLLLSTILNYEKSGKTKWSLITTPLS